MHRACNYPGPTIPETPDSNVALRQTNNWSLKSPTLAVVVERHCWRSIQDGRLAHIVPYLLKSTHRCNLQPNFTASSSAQSAATTSSSADGELFCIACRWLSLIFISTSTSHAPFTITTDRHFPDKHQHTHTRALLSPMNGNIATTPSHQPTRRGDPNLFIRINSQANLALFPSHCLASCQLLHHIVPLTNRHRCSSQSFINMVNL